MRRNFWPVNKCAFRCRRDKQTKLRATCVANDRIYTLFICALCDCRMSMNLRVPRIREGEAVLSMMLESCKQLCDF